MTLMAKIWTSATLGPFIPEKISRGRTLATACIRGERNHLYECGLHKMGTAGIKKKKKAKRLALVRKIAIFYTVVSFQLTFWSSLELGC